MSGEAEALGDVLLGISSLATAEVASGFVVAISPGAGGAAAGNRAAGMGDGAGAAISGARSVAGGVATAAATGCPPGAVPVEPIGPAAVATLSLEGMGLTATCSAGGRISMNQPPPAIAIRKTRATPRRAQGARRAGGAVSTVPGAPSSSTPKETARLEMCGAASGVPSSTAVGRLACVA